MNKFNKLLAELAFLYDKNPGRDKVTQLQHCIQCAQIATSRGADDEMILIALLHDAGKPLSETYHGEVMAEMLREYISENRYHVLRTHGEFQTNYDAAFSKYCDQPWIFDACRLYEWDCAAFDPENTSHYSVALHNIMRKVLP